MSTFVSAANPHLKNWARSEYAKALRAKTISRGPCEVCGRAVADGHHEDYAEPARVVWLCRLHHTYRHRGHTVSEMRSWGYAA